MVSCGRCGNSWLVRSSLDRAVLVFHEPCRGHCVQCFVQCSRARHFTFCCQYFLFQSSPANLYKTRSKKTGQGQQVLTKTRPKTMCSHPGYKVIHLALHIMSSSIILQFAGGNTFTVPLFAQVYK